MGCTQRMQSGPPWAMMREQHEVKSGKWGNPETCSGPGRGQRRDSMADSYSKRVFSPFLPCFLCSLPSLALSSPFPTPPLPALLPLVSVKPQGWCMLSPCSTLSSTTSPENEGV